MKTRSIARGIVGSVAALLGVMAAGCSADVAPGDESASVGSSEQAIRIAHSCDNTKTDLSDSGYAAEYPAYFPISSTEVLVIGGYNTLGNAITTVKKYNKNSDTWTTMASLNAARGEAVVAPITGTKLLVLGGKSSTATNTQLDTAEIYDYSSTGTATALTNSATHKLSSPRVHFNLTACGTSKLLVAGGRTTSGGVESVVDTLEVFTYDSGTPANSTFALMKNKKTPTADTVVLNSTREFAGALPFNSNADIFMVGGENSAGNILGSVEKISVDTSCNLNSTTATAPTVATSLPSSAVRSRFHFAPVALTISSVTYEGLVVAGYNRVNNADNLPVDTIALDISGSSGLGAWVAGPSLGNGRGKARPAVAVDSSGNFAIIGGDVASSRANAGSGSEVSTAKVDYFTNSGAGSWLGSPTDMCTPRVGPWGAFIDSLNIAGHGRDTIGASFPQLPE